MKHKIYKESTLFQKFIFIQKYEKKSHVPKQLFSFFIKNCNKKIQKFIRMEKKNWQKNHVVFFSNNTVSSFYFVCAQQLVNVTPCDTFCVNRKLGA
jgi:hypothetical protein